MNPVPTSRGTVIKKQLAVIEQATFPLDDILSVGGEFAQELLEIHRHLGTQLDTAYLRDVFVPNIESIKQQYRDNINDINTTFRSQILSEIESPNLIPKTDSPNDPKIIKHEVNDNVEPYYQLTLSYHKSPYKEERVERLEAEDADWANIG